MSVNPISQDLFNQYKKFYECLINDCLVENDVAIIDVDHFPTLSQDLKDQAKESIDRYKDECGIYESESEPESDDGGSHENLPPQAKHKADFTAKFYVMKATHLVDGKMEIDYHQFRILVGDYVYTNFQPIWPDGKSHVGTPWSEIVLDEHYSPPGSNTPSSRPFRYKASSDELFFKESDAGEWQRHPMGSHYDQLAYYLSDYENTFSVEG